MQYISVYIAGNMYSGSERSSAKNKKHCCRLLRSPLVSTFATAHSRTSYGCSLQFIIIQFYFGCNLTFCVIEYLYELCIIHFMMLERLEFLKILSHLYTLMSYDLPHIQLSVSHNGKKLWIVSNLKVFVYLFFKIGQLASPILSTRQSTRFFKKNHSI